MLNSKIMYNSDNDKFEFIHNKLLTKKQKQHYIKIYTGLVKLIEDESRKTGDNQKQRINVLQDKLISIIQSYPELLYMKHYKYNKSYLEPYHDDYSISFQKHLLNREFFGVLENICQNIDICKLEAFMGSSLLFLIAPFGGFSLDKDFDEKRLQLVRTLLKKHPELFTFKDENYNQNLGMYLIGSINDDNQLSDEQTQIVKQFIEHPIACLQQDGTGCNLGMLAAYYKNQELFDLAYQNPKARMQKNKHGDTMEMIANNNGLIIPPLTDEQVYDFYNEIISKKIDDICR